ncbi:MAG: 5-carboxymethyl-2-hydroxymuconate Delta-isomerase [Rhizobiaceae bacterium]
MPHLTIEYSANLDGMVDIDRLCAELLDAAMSTGIFEIGAPRVRAIRCDHFAIADRHDANAFVDMSLRVGQGRSAEQKRRAGEAIYAAASARLAALFETPHFALSLEVREIDKALSWKKNSMHARLRDQGTKGNV